MAQLLFLLQKVGTSSKPLTVKLTNLGDTALVFGSIRITGVDATDFSEKNTCVPSIAAGKNCTISVTFKPTAKGKRSARVSINDNGGGSPQKVSLTGTGT